MPNPPTERAKYTRMQDSTVEDYRLITQYQVVLKGRLIDHILAMLETLKQEDVGLKLNRYEHSLQSATLAHNDGCDDETIFIALLHDIGDNLAPENHSELAAAVLRPYISEKSWWIVQHHGIFQGYYFWHHIGKDRNAREAYRGHKWFDACAEWCDKYDQRAFDPAYPTKDLAFFFPLVHRLLARDPWSLAPREQRTVGAH